MRRIYRSNLASPASMQAEFIDVSETYGSSQLVRITGPGTRLIVAGQAPLGEDGTLAGSGDIEAQTRAAFENVGRRLAAAGASFEQLVKVTIYLIDIRRHQEAVRR